MANDGKFLNLENGQYKLDQAIAVSAGAGDANKIPRLDATGKFDTTLFPASITPETRSQVASEALAAGNLVNMHNNGGTINMRRADAAANGKQANGFVLAAIGAAASGTFYPEENVVTGLTGLTVGATYYLSTTAGGITTTPPSASGQVVQEVGYAMSATELFFRPRRPILLA